MHSMTGFGRAEGSVEGHRFVVEAKSVNHRYVDVRFRLPSMLLPFESSLSQQVKSRFARGSFEISVRQLPLKESLQSGVSTQFCVDLKAAQSFVKCCEMLHKTVGTVKSASLEAMVMTNRIFSQGLKSTNPCVPAKIASCVVD